MIKENGEIIQFKTNNEIAECSQSSRLAAHQCKQLKGQKDESLNDVLNFIGILKADMIKEIQNPSIEESVLYEFQQTLHHQVALLDILSDYIRQKV